MGVSPKIVNMFGVKGFLLFMVGIIFFEMGGGDLRSGYMRKEG